MTFAAVGKSMSVKPYEAGAETLLALKLPKQLQ